MGVTGESLSILHHTYGHDPEVVSAIIEVSPEIMKDYYKKMEEERVRSRSSQKKQIIEVRK